MKTSKIKRLDFTILPVDGNITFIQCSRRKSYLF